MDKAELEALLHDVEELKRAVRRNNPFLREMMSTPFYPALGLIFGLLVLAFSVAAQILVVRYGSLGGIPSGWKAAAWVALILYVVLGGIMKWTYLSRRARSIDGGATYSTVIRAIYGGSFLHMNLPIALCMFLAPVFAIVVGHPWYTIPGTAVFFAFLCNSVGLIVHRTEYLAAGWYTLLTSLFSLFFLEQMPLVWLGIIWGGGLVVFGVVGLVVHGRRSPA